MNNITEKNIDISLLPRLNKIIHLIDTCHVGFNIEPKFRNMVKALSLRFFSKDAPDSSRCHCLFSERLKERLSHTDMTCEVLDEYECDITGTHLDIAMPHLKICVEINGPTHYLMDGITENNETQFKRELLEEFGWVVVPVSVCNDMHNKKGDFNMDKIDDIISDTILPLLEQKGTNGTSRLKDDVNKIVYLVDEEVVEDPTEAQRRIKECLESHKKKHHQEIIFLRNDIPIAITFYKDCDKARHLQARSLFDHLPLETIVCAFNIRNVSDARVGLPTLLYKSTESNLGIRALLDPEINPEQFDVTEESDNHRLNLSSSF